MVAGKAGGVEPVPEWGRILLGGFGSFLLAWLSLGVAPGIAAAPLWLVDALLICLALDRAGRELAAGLAAGGIGIFVACLLVGGAFVVAVVLVPIASILHVALARFLLLRFAPESPRLTTPGALAHVLLWSALVSPIPGAFIVAGVALSGDGSLPATQALVAWWVASAVGTAILLPFLLSLVHGSSSDLKLLLGRWREALFVVALVVLVAAIARQATGPFPALLGLPVVLWAALRLDFRATALLCVIVALLPMAAEAIGSWAPSDASIALVEERQAYLLAIIVPALFASLFTEEQRAGDRARQTALQALRAVMDAVPLAIVTSTPEGHVGLWSRGAERIFGWRRSAVEGREPPFVAPDHAAQDASLRQRVLAGNEIQNQPAQRLNDEGATRELIINAAPLRDAENAITGIISVMEDVTDRRRLEESREEQRARLAAILDAVADPIITSDEEGAITSFSRAAETVFGYAASEVIGQNLSALMPDPDRSRHDAYLRRYRETGVKRIIGTSRPVTAQRKDGSTFPAEITISEAWLDGKRIFAGMVRDLSATPSAKAAQAPVPPADSGTAKSLSKIAHDLRQPLHALSLMTSALERRVKDPESREIVEDLSRTVRATQSTFENIVDWTRLEGGLVGSAPTAVPLEELLGALAQEFAPEAVRRNLVFRWVPSRATIAADPALLRRILRQLLDNALTFTPAGKVLLGARRHGSMLRLIVADTGVGIPAGQEDFIFGPYNQLEEGRAVGGLGLGLAIARRLAELAGLTIGVRSLSGKGSLFWVDVPLAVRS
jgi:two-component system, sensor histidine kinase